MAKRMSERTSEGANDIDGIDDNEKLKPLAIHEYTALLCELTQDAPNSISEILTHVASIEGVDVYVIIGGSILLERFHSRYPSCTFKETKYPLMATLILAMKMVSADIYSNKSWSTMSGIPLETLNACELEWVKYVNYDFFVSHVEFECVRKRLLLLLQQQQQKQERRQQQGQEQTEHDREEHDLIIRARARVRARAHERARIRAHAHVRKTATATIDVCDQSTLYCEFV